jgi:FeS assembly protein IscX
VAHHHPDHFGWTDIDDIAEALAAAHPAVDPLTLRFTALRGMIEALANFRPEPGHPVNERILEEVQAAWCEARSGHAPRGDDED